MRDRTVSTREMSRAFTKLLREVVTEGAEVTITSQGKPVAVLCRYKDYKRAARKSSLERLMDLADSNLKGLTLEGTYYRSRAELEGRAEDG